MSYAYDRQRLNQAAKKFFLDNGFVRTTETKIMVHHDSNVEASICFYPCTYGIVLRKGNAQFKTGRFDENLLLKQLKKWQVI